MESSICIANFLPKQVNNLYHRVLYTLQNLYVSYMTYMVKNLFSRHHHHFQYISLLCKFS
jgi:hypothetical protein